jgi:hypothetical protein
MLPSREFELHAIEDYLRDPGATYCPTKFALGGGTNTLSRSEIARRLVVFTPRPFDQEASRRALQAANSVNVPVDFNYSPCRTNSMSNTWPSEPIGPIMASITRPSGECRSRSSICVAMKFRLTYSGSLKASGNKSNHTKEKWSIRRALHPQLAELWQTHPVLRGHFAPPYARPSLQPRGGLAPIIVGDAQFIPLVRESLGLSCDLDIIFMRKEPPGSLVLQGGDIDNRIKTLFDGLRVPSIDEMKAGSPDADPFYCVLEQDALITGVNVRTDRLLTAPNASVHEVHLVIEVSVRVMRIDWENIGYLGE